jgi:hypothetical protein
MSPDVTVAADAVTETAVKAGQGASVLAHIVERRLEYLIGTLIAHQLGLLDQLVTYGSGMC